MADNFSMKMTFWLVSVNQEQQCLGYSKMIQESIKSAVGEWVRPGFSLDYSFTCNLH